jgi:serine/threonine protein kinase
MSYFFTAKDLQGLYGQNFSITNSTTRSAETVEIQRKEIFPARAGLEGYGIRALHRHATRGNVHTFLKIFQKDVPQRHGRSQFLVKMGLAKHHEWIFQGVPYAWLNRRKVNGIEIVGHLTKFIGLQYGAPAEDLMVLKDDGKWHSYSNAERRSLAIHLALAICGLEKLSLVHGDLSPGNVMIGPGPNETDVCCLCDFDGFQHPSVSRLPRKIDGIPTRPLGSEGYQYPELVERIGADKNNDDETIIVETDRFALGVLICEMMVWSPSVMRALGRAELLDKRIILSRRLSGIPEEVGAMFPKGFALLESALRAGSCSSMPTPEDWLNCLGQALVARFQSAPMILFYRGQGPEKELHRRAVLSSKPSGSFGMVHSDLADIAFNRDSQNQVTLSINGGVPGALKRCGQQRGLTTHDRASLKMAPGDVLHIGGWEIEFMDSAEISADKPSGQM